jgi:hypothetical protein
MPGTHSYIHACLTGSPVSVKWLTSALGYSWWKTFRNGSSADILGLKFLPVRSEGSHVILQRLGDLA